MPVQYLSFTFHAVARWKSRSFYPYKLSLNKNAKAFHLYCTDSYKIQSMGKTMVWLSSSYSTSFWRTGCFFQSSRIAKYKSTWVAAIEIIGTVCTRIGGCPVVVPLAKNSACVRDGKALRRGACRYESSFFEHSVFLKEAGMPNYIHASLIAGTHYCRFWMTYCVVSLLPKASVLSQATDCSSSGMQFVDRWKPWEVKA